MGIVTREIGGAWRFLARIRGYVAAALLVFILVTALSGFVITQVPGAADAAMEQISQMFESKDLFEEADDGDGIAGTGMQINTVKLIANNLVAMAVGMGMGAVPFLFLPVLPLIVNALLIGVLGGALHLAGASLTRYFLFGVLPHGIFELGALFIAYGMGFYLCLALMRKLLRSRKRQPLGETLKEILRAFVLVVVPLTIVAGLVEAYITPLLMGYFLL